MKRQIEELNEKLNTKSVKKLPSRFQIGDKVKLVFGDAGTLTNCRILKVHFSESKVLYDVEVIMHYQMIDTDFSKDMDTYLKEEFLTRLYNVDSAFLTEA